MMFYVDYYYSQYGVGFIYELDICYKFIDCVIKYLMLSYVSYENEWDLGCEQ